MDDAFDKMMELMEAPEPDPPPPEDNIEDADYNAELLELQEQIRQIAPAERVFKIRPLVAEYTEFDPSNNVLVDEVRDKFKREKILEESEIFTQPVSTTYTMEGFLSNVQFHEEQLIQELLPDEDMVMFRCNYGKVKLPEYTEPVKLRKTNRGRKKKEKKKKSRKKPGSGDDFNSQITFVTRSQIEPLTSPTAYSKVYKFKIFRTGKLQLPGVHPEHIDDVIDCTRKIAQTLNFYLHPGEPDTAKRTTVVNINPVMKNYKFLLKLPPGHIIDMEILRQILAHERSKQYGPLDDTDEETTHTDAETDTEDNDMDESEDTHGGADVPDDHNEHNEHGEHNEHNEHNADNDEYVPANVYNHNITSPEHPSIFMLKYTRQDTKLSIKFNTPIYKKPKKMTRINIFMRGKINILGAFNTEVTTQICEYLQWIFRMYWNNIVVPEGVPEPRIDRYKWVENIEQLDDATTRSIVHGFINWLPPLPHITEQEYALACEFVDDCYNECVSAANNYLTQLLAETDLAEWIGTFATGKPTPLIDYLHDKFKKENDLMHLDYPELVA